MDQGWTVEDHLRAILARIIAAPRHSTRAIEVMPHATVTGAPHFIYELAGRKAWVGDDGYPVVTGAETRAECKMMAVLLVQALKEDQKRQSLRMRAVRKPLSNLAWEMLALAYLELYRRAGPSGLWAKHAKRQACEIARNACPQCAKEFREATRAQHQIATYAVEEALGLFAQNISVFNFP